MRFCYLFPNGHSRAVTFSYDDGVIQDERLVGIFNRYGVKATFNINSGSRYPGKIPPEHIASLYAGHEVASHAEFHSALDRLPATDVLRELWHDRENLERLCGVPVTGFAYPYGLYSDAAVALLKAAGFEYARTVGEIGGNRRLPDDFLRWDPSCHHRDALEHMKTFFADKSRMLSVLYIWGHSYEFDRDGNWDLIEEICRQLAGRDDVWFATNIEICRYIKAIRSLVSGANGDLLYNPTAQTVWFSSDAWAHDDIRSIRPGETVSF